MHIRLALPVLLFAILLVGVGHAEEKPGDSPKYAPTSEYDVRDMLGWKVYWRKQLSEHPRLAKQTEDELRNQLYLTTRVVPAGPLAKLREIPIWIELHLPHAPCANYHSHRGWVVDNGLNPDKTKCVEIANARNFVNWTLKQPWMVLHELAHGYHDQFLDDGFANPAVLAAYERAKAGGLYEDVLRYSGQQVRHYALNNQMEYFAEATEAYFGLNDYFPFNRTELVAFDPAGAAMIEQVWECETLQPGESLPEELPWNLADLSKEPAFKWGDQADGVRQLTFWTEKFGDVERAEVFGYYSTPGILKGDDSLDHDLPGIVLVHGGGGTAFPEWIKLWAARGYAAIALDYSGCGPDRKRLAHGGPGQGNEHKFDAVDQPYSEQWTYHAVANTIRAHSFLRQQQEVDKSRTAITGISWGGYLTCITAGVDNRFAAAVPVYGCGFLQDGSSWDNIFAKMTPEQRERWHKLWDPSRYVGAAEMPVLFVNGTNDFAYWMPSYVKTYELVKRPDRNLCITVRMPHGHPQGWAPNEIELFIEQHLNGGTPLPKFSPIQLTNAKGAVAKLTTETPIKKTEFHWTTDGGPSPKRQWHSKPAEHADGEVFMVNLPEGVTGYFFTATDERDATVSSEVVLSELDR